VAWFNDWKEKSTQRKKEKKEFKPYAKMMTKFFELSTKGEMKELREFVIHNVLHEEMPHDLTITQLGVIAGQYEELGAYETAVEFYDAIFSWSIKGERTIDEGVRYTMERIQACNRPDLLEKWIVHYGDQMSEEDKLKFMNSTAELEEKSFLN